MHSNITMPSYCCMHHFLHSTAFSKFCLFFRVTKYYKIIVKNWRFENYLRRHDKNLELEK